MVKFSSMGYDTVETEETPLKNLSRNWSRFCLKHRNWGIPNLMLYIAAGNAIVYILSLFDPSNFVYALLCFDRTAILQGQVWRLLTFVIASSADYDLLSGFLTLIMLFFYYRIGVFLEQRMGTFKFNLFYFSGVMFMAIAGMLLGQYVSSSSLNMSLILAFAALFAEAQVLLMFIIPLKMKWLAWVYLAMTAWECLVFSTLLPLVPLLNFFLFFWAELPNLLPDFMRRKRVKNYRTAPPPKSNAKPGPNWADDYRSKTGEKPYRHKCSVCGRTDTQFPDLEFRYCSRCNGYHCYCMEHINNHVHKI